jgi:hypothetical protein
MDLDERVRRQVRLLRPSRPRRTPLGRPLPTAPPDAPEPTPEAETQLLPVVRPDRHDNG